MKKIILILISFTLSVGCTQMGFAQKKYSTGLQFDDEAHNRTLLKKESKNRGRNGLLLSQVSLKPFCPTPQSQGDYYTCVGWAIGYAACTISEAISKNIQDKARIDVISTSPTYVYMQGKPQKAGDCYELAKIDTALHNLKSIPAIPRHQDFGEICVGSRDILSKTVSEGVRITDYVSLYKSTDSFAQKLYAIKQTLSNRKPVVAAIQTYQSMKTMKKVWSGKLDQYSGGHAICIIGYEDDLEGGVIEFMNSWGADWGEKGFGKIRYTDLEGILKYAFELTVQNTEPPKPSLLKASIELQLLSDSSNMPLELIAKKSLPMYKTTKAYGEGTQYRLSMDYSETIYTYILSSDLTGRFNKLFPADARTSPQLSNPNAPLVLPREDSYIELDDTQGKDYVIVLCAKTPLPIDNWLTAWNQQTGTALDKVQKTLQSQLQSFVSADASNNKISFEAFLNSKNIILLTLEMEHQ